MIERIKWVDYSKVIGIWLVVLGHMQDSNVFLIDMIYSFHIPFFFFISGFLAKKDSVKATVAKGVKALVIPYVTYYLIAWVWWFFVSYLRHPELFNHNNPIIEILLKPFAGLLFGVGYNTSVSTMVNIPIWFLISLFVVSFLFSIFSRIDNYYIRLIFVVATAVLSFLASIFDVDLLFSIDSALMVFPFYVCGFYSRQYWGRAENYIARGNMICLTLIIVVVSLLVLFGVSMTNGKVDVNNNIFGACMILFYVGGVGGIMFVVGLSVLLASFFYTNFIQIASVGTIFIMGLHGVITGLLMLPIKVLNIENVTCVNLVVSALVIVVSIPLIVVSRRYFPILYGFRSNK